MQQNLKFVLWRTNWKDCSITICADLITTGQGRVVIIFNEGPCYLFSARHPPPQRYSSKAISLFKIADLSLSPPKPHSNYYWYVESTV